MTMRRAQLRGARGRSSGRGKRPARVPARYTQPSWFTRDQGILASAGSSNLRAVLRSPIKLGRERLMNFSRGPLPSATPYMATMPGSLRRGNATITPLRLSKCMPRYAFIIHDGGPDSDPLELDFPDVRAARAEAIRAAGEMLRDLDGTFSGEEWRMNVIDESGKRLLTLRFCAEEHT